MTTEKDSVNTGALATIVVVGALAMVGISAAVTAMVRYEQDAHNLDKGTTANVKPYQKLVAEQRAELTADPAWVDEATGKVSLPVDMAMDVVARELQNNPYSATPAPPEEQEERADAGADAGAEQADAGAQEPGQADAGAEPSRPTPANEPTDDD